MNTLIIINLIIGFIILLYLSIKIFLFPHRKVENLIKYDNDIYIKINKSTFYTIKANMMNHLESDESCDKYTATFRIMKFIYSTDIRKVALIKTNNRIINGITVDYINNQLEKIMDKEISSKTDATDTKDFSEENKQG